MRRVAERLLVIDADGELRNAYQSHFSRSGFDVHCAATVADAASLLEVEPFDAVIADVRDFPADGRDDPAIGRVLERTPRVVVLTAYGEPEWARTAARLGVDAFLHKPVSLVWLEGLLRARIEQARSRSDGGVAATG